VRRVLPWKSIRVLNNVIFILGSVLSVLLFLLLLEPDFLLFLSRVIVLLRL